MNITSSTLRKLASLNLSPEQMAGVLSLMADDLEKEEIRKEKQAERKRKSRANKCDGHTHVTGQSQDTPSNGSNGFSLEPFSLNSLTPPKENPPKGGQKKTPQIEKLELPDWLPFAEWKSFEEMRNKIKKPMTASAQRLAIGKLEKFKAMGHDPTEILNRSILNNWQDLFEPKEKTYDRNFANIPKQQLTATERDKLARKGAITI